MVVSPAEHSNKKMNKFKLTIFTIFFVIIPLCHINLLSISILMLSILFIINQLSGRFDVFFNLKVINSNKKVVIILGVLLFIFIVTSNSKSSSSLPIGNYQSLRFENELKNINDEFEYDIYFNMDIPMQRQEYERLKRLQNSNDDIKYKRESYMYAVYGVPSAISAKIMKEHCTFVRELGEIYDYQKEKIDYLKNDFMNDLKKQNDCVAEYATKVDGYAEPENRVRTVVCKAENPDDIKYKCYLPLQNKRPIPQNKSQ